jgi:hypothetical protein
MEKKIDLAEERIKHLLSTFIMCAKGDSKEADKDTTFLGTAS